MSSTPATPPQDSTPTRNWTPRKKLIATLGVLTGLLLLLVIAWAFQWFRPSPAIQVSRHTTFVTEPLGPDGLPDLRRARMLRNGQGLSADENGAEALFQAIGKDGTDEADWPALAETLQIDPGSVTGRLGTQFTRTAERELRQVAAALAVFRTENGSYPRSLTELVPHLLDEMPVDSMHGEPIRYSPDDHGGVLLHSVGPNGKDDAGSRAAPSIFRGLYLHDWSWYEKPGRRALLDELSDAGHEIDADALSNLDPNSLIDPDADDFSWRSPLPQPDLPAVIRSELDRTQTD